MVDDSIENRIVRHLEHIKKIHKIDCKDEQTRHAIIDCIISGGNKKEVYFQAFKNITSRIKYEWGHILKENTKSKEYDVGIEKVMHIFFEIKEFGKILKRKRIEIYKIKILPYHYSRHTYQWY